MRGSELKRRSKSGGWSFVIDEPTPDGRRRQRRITLPAEKTKREAEEERTRLLAAAQSGTYVKKTKETTAEFLRRWLGSTKPPKVRPNTWTGYEARVRRHMIPAIGIVQLQALTPAHIQAVQNHVLEKSLSTSEARHAHTILSTALKAAVVWGDLHRNPADSVKGPPMADSEPVMWTIAVIQSFLSKAPDNVYGNLARLVIQTGLRRSEVVGLKWTNSGVETGVLEVSSNLQRVKGEGLLEHSPKSKRGRRPIALGKSAIALLRHVRAQQVEQRLKAGPLWNKTGYVFTQATGRPLDPNRVTRTFRAMVDAMELPYMNIQNLRHCHATLLLAQGENLKLISRRMGHANESTTLRIYAHLLPGTDVEAADRLDRVLFGGASA